MVETAIGMVFFLVGVVTLGIAAIDSIRGFRARHWAILEAVVLDRGIKTHRGRRNWFVPTVRYRYQVEGRTYESNRIMFGHLSTTDRNDAERFMSYFEIGRPVPVYVSPVHPHVSVVKPGVDNQMWFRIVWASFAAFIGAGLVLKQLK